MRPFGHQWNVGVRIMGMTECSETLTGKFVECCQALRRGVRIGPVSEAGQYALKLRTIKAVSVCDNCIDGSAQLLPLRSVSNCRP